MMNESPDPADQKWFNTDAGRTIIGASIVGANHPAGAVKRSDLHPHLHAELSGADHRAELSGAEFSGPEHRVELGRAVHFIDHIGTLAQRHPRAGRHVTAKGSITGGSVVSRWSALLVGGRQHHEFSG
jgi:hypothetical protein